MIQTFQHIFSFIIAILVLITVHEFGHYWVARRCNIKVLRFSIGFGKPIWRWRRKDGSEVVICILPLGGYVKMLDEIEGDVPASEKHLAFNRHSVWQRLLVVFAGPLTNFLFAILAFWLMFVIGLKPVVPLIGQIEPNSIAAHAGLQTGQRFVSIDGHKITTWQNVLMAVARRLGEKGSMNVTTRPLNGGSEQSYQLNLTTWRVNDLMPEPLESLGIIPYQPPLIPVIAKVIPKGPAAKAGLRVGDRIVGINDIPISDWYGVTTYIQRHSGKKVNLKILRAGQPLTITITIGKRLVGLRWLGYLGIESKVGKWPENMRFSLNYSVFSAWLPAVSQVYQLTTFNFIMLGKMIIGRVSIQSLGGPITIFRTADKAFKQGVVIYIGFLALISVMLAFVNLLPIPGLDGGHILYYLIEIVRRKPLSVAVQMLTLRLGVILLIVLIAQATINDVLRLF